MKVDRIRGALAAAFIILALMLGGASGNGAGALANGLLQVLALIAILTVLWTRPNTAYPRQATALSWIVAAFLFWVLLSLIPLPSSIWQALPGREAIARGFQLLGLEDVSLPLTLTLQRSIASILWLLPPAAMFLLTLQSSHEQRKRMAWVVIGMAIVSIGLGAAQLLGGEESALRPYAITSTNLPVGFFANGNHLGTFLLCTLPLAGYIAARSAGKRKQRARRNSGMMLSVAVSIFIFVGIASIGSLAGYGLAVPVGVASLLIYRRAAHGRISPAWWAASGAIFVVFLGLALAGPLDQEELAGEYSADPASRRQMVINTSAAAADFFPFGSGLGSFQDIYRTVDDPNRISFEYVNHAHNDYVEIALELGLPGILLVLAFLAWWAVSAAKAWRSDDEGSNLARAGSVIISVVLFHSLVEFPIRTSAIACLFAMACALMIRPWLWVKRTAEPREQDQAGGLRHLQVE